MLSTSPPTKTPKSASLRILPSDKQAWDALLQDLCKSDRTQAQKMNSLLHWIESARQQKQPAESLKNTHNATLKPTDESATLPDARSPLGRASLEQLLTVPVGDFLVKEIEFARVRLFQLEQQHQMTAAALEQSQSLVQQLQAENTQLHAELEQLRQSHSQLAPLLGLLQGLALAQSHPSQSATITQSDRPTANATPSTPTSQSPPLAPPSREIPQTDSTSTPPPKKTHSGWDSTAAKINAIVDALIEWNHSCTISTRRLRIGIQPIKGLASKWVLTISPSSNRCFKIDNQNSRSYINTSS